MKNETRKGLSALTILSAPLMAQESGVPFNHENWEVVCDNTLTCRTAGYSPGEGKGGSVLLTRQTDAGTSVSGEVMLAELQSDGAPQPSKLTLLVNDQLVGGVKPDKEGNWRLSAKRTRDVIATVKGSRRVEFKGGPDPLALSGEGACVVLLKVDGVQGRIGTPGTLTKKGDKPENSVQAAAPAPVIYQVKPEKTQERPPTVPEFVVLRPKLLATLSKDDRCDRVQPSEEQEAKTVSLTPLDNVHFLVSALCWRAAYNEGYGYWVVDSKLAGKPELITVSGSDYGDGVIFISQKGYGLGDCWGSVSWVWNSETLRKNREATAGMYRYFHLGGTWDLPTWVTDVKPAK